MKKFILILLLLALILTGLYFYKENDYKTSLSKSVDVFNKEAVKEILVEKGDSPSSIASKLEKANVVVNKEYLLRYLKESKLDSQIKAGTFYISPASTIPEISDILIGKMTPDNIRITIPEGYTISDIGQLLEKKGLGSAKDFTDCIYTTCNLRVSYDFLPKRKNIEGYLFPDTYFINRYSYSPEKFISTLLDTFEKKVVNGLEKELLSSNKTLDEIIIMASVIEKEAGSKDDKNIISGILWKRLDNNIQLAADAINRYGKANPQDNLTITDLTSDDPYNARLKKGLPPSAISSPGISSIKAAMSPKDSDYFYYLHDENGDIHYSSTENEHEQMKAKYLNN